LEQSFGISRFAYNWALKSWQTRREAEEKSDFMKLRNALNEIKRKDFPWMLNVPKDVPAEAIRNLCDAFDRFFINHRVKSGSLWPGCKRTQLLR